jgi:BolA family transcriptional regulator, general stress-responsive regulator
MIVQRNIEAKLRAALDPAHLEVINESYMHSVPPGSESHFKVIVVSECFEGQGLLARHQAVNVLLGDELQYGVHALSMQTHTPEEWARRGGQILASPACRGGGKTGT